MTAEDLHWFICPECRISGRIDDDQLHGRVSIVCPNCDWHEVHDWTTEKNLARQKELREPVRGAR